MYAASGKQDYHIAKMGVVTTFMRFASSAM